MPGVRDQGDGALAMYDLKTAAGEVRRVMTSSEGVDVAAASRIFAHDERTIRRWLARGAHHAELWGSDNGSEHNLGLTRYTDSRDEVLPELGVRQLFHGLDESIVDLQVELEFAVRSLDAVAPG